MRRPGSRLGAAAWTLALLGVAVAANAILMFDADGAYQRAVNELTAAAVPSIGDWSAFARVQSQFAAAGGAIGLILATAHVVAALLMLRGAAWAPILAIVVALVGTLNGAFSLAAIAIAPGWLVPLPMFAALDRSAAIPLTIVGAALAAISYAYVAIV